MNAFLKLFAGVCTLAVTAASAQTAVTVSGTANIYGAGLAAPLASNSSCGTASNGTAPVLVSIPPGATSFSLTSSSGTVACVDPGNVATSGDGPCQGLTNTNITGENNLSGIVHSGSTMFLMGVFLGASAPVAPAPAGLSYTAGNVNFASQSAQLQQVFFVGDGLTGSGTGATQQFVIPSGATRLFLGFADASSFQGASGCFQDNAGTRSAVVTFAGSPTVVPTWAGWWAIAIASILLVGAAYRSGHRHLR